MHRKAAVGDVPTDQCGRVGQGRGERLAERKADRFCDDERGGGAIAELEHREQRFERGVVLQMQRRQLDAQDKHARLRVGPYDVACAAQRGDGGVTAHETDQEPLDRRGEADLRRDDLVDAGGDEAGTARHHEMRDPVERSLRAQRLDRGDAQDWRRLGIQPHPLGRTWGQVTCVKAAGIDRRSAIGAARQNRPAMPDRRAPRHPIEHARRPRIGQPRSRPADKGLVNVVIGNSGADRGDMGSSRQSELSGGAGGVRPDQA